MGSVLREWIGFQQFPTATQSKLVELFAKLKEEGVDKLTILVMGKGGVGKSSTVNSLFGERAVNVSSFQSEGFRPVMVSRNRAGFTLNIIDTPGLVEGGYVSYQALDMIKRFLLNKTIHVLLYVDRLDAYRVDDLDKQIIGAISDSFGKEIWSKSLLVLTHAQLSPPDDLSYDVFCARRSEAVLKTIRMGARIRKRDFEDSAIPVGLVENSGRCNKNENDEKILPNGDAWIPSLVKEIILVATNGKKALVVDEKFAKCKTLLKLTIPRIKLLRNRREIQIKQMHRDVAKLLETGQEATSRIRVENIIREENMMAAQEIIELFCELITVRLPIIETQRECPLDLKEAISSVCFAAPRCGDLPELLQVQTLFASKYGREFVAAATELRPACGVNRQLIQLLSVCAPSPEAKLKLLKEIAEEHELDWDPAASETELLKKNEDLLNGPTHITILPLPKEKQDEVLNAPDPAKHEQSDSDTGFDPLDFPEVPEASLWPSANSASAPGIAPPEQAALHPDIDHESSNHYVTNKDLSQEPHIVHQDVIEEKSAATRDEISSTMASAREEKQFLSSISLPSLSSASFSSPPSALRTKSEVNVDLQNVSSTVETAKHATIPSTSPPHVTRTRTEANVDLQDVLAAVHAAAETAECAAAAARSAATLAQAKISELTKKNSERLHESGYDNPFFVDTPDLSASADKPRFVHQQSFGDGDNVANYKDFHRLHEGHQASELLDIPSFEKLKVDYDSPRSDHVVEQGYVSHQPQRLPSMDDEPYFSYPNLFTSQNSNLGSSALSATDHSNSIHDL